MFSPLLPLQGPQEAIREPKPNRPPLFWRRGGVISRSRLGHTPAEGLTHRWSCLSILVPERWGRAVNIFAKCFLIAALVLPAMSSAQVYRCKQADGKTSYQQSPCPTGQQQSRPSIMRAPTLTDEERLRAAKKATPSDYSSQPDSSRHMGPDPQQAVMSAQRKRERECNARYDQLLKNNGSDWAKRHGLSVERDRAACIYGSGSHSSGQEIFMQSSNRLTRGQCQGQCASQQGQCVAQCRGNGQCIASCSATHGQCQAMCSRL